MNPLISPNYLSNIVLFKCGQHCRTTTVIPPDCYCTGILDFCKSWNVLVPHFLEARLRLSLCCGGLVAQCETPPPAPLLPSLASHVSRALHLVPLSLSSFSSSLSLSLCLSLSVSLSLFLSFSLAHFSLSLSTQYVWAIA